MSIGQPGAIPMTIPSLRGRTILVVGLGASGLSAVRALMASGVHTIAFDDHADARQRAQGTGARVLSSLDTLDHLMVDAVVLSPGIPHHLPAPHPAAAWAIARQVPVWCDVDLFAQGLKDHGFKGRVLGVTGSNGKSTTTALLAHLLHCDGRIVHMGGNIGVPVLDLPLVTAADTFYVLELSSFQLERVPHLTIHGAILLNITPDHLDRHGTFENYARIKRSIFDHLVPGGIGIHMDPLDPLDDLPDGLVLPQSLPGRHNRQNVVAAYRLWRGMGLCEKAFVGHIGLFPGLPHRLEKVGQDGHVTYINDSKATNGASAFQALACYDRIYWIVGGVPKAGGLDGVDAFYSRIIKAYTIGTAAEDFAAVLAPHVPVVIAGDLETAVQQAHGDGQGDPLPSVVLLSPAAASYDHFRHFEHRGDVFRLLVGQHIGEHTVNRGKNPSGGPS